MAVATHPRSKILVAAAVLWVVAGILTFPAFFLNIMAFDAPGSTENLGTYVWVFGLIVTPVLAVIGGILAFWTKRSGFLLSPSAGLAAWVAGRAIEALTP